METKSADKKPEIQNDKSRCQFYVEHKKRYCKMLVAEGNQYCGQHLVGQTDLSGKKYKRIPCPLDPKHSCYEHRLEIHLKHCNAKEDNTCPYKTLNCNLGPIIEEPKIRRIAELSEKELEKLICQIEEVHSKYIENTIKSDILNQSSIDEFINSKECGKSEYRHLKQNGSIVGHVKTLSENLKDKQNVCFLEFGAGRGQVTKWLINALEDYSNKSFLLIDRGAQRHKQDAKLRCNPDLDIKRLRIDIQHLDLKRVDATNSSSHLFGIGKHLCGAATDLSLRCLAENSSCSSIGIVIALCCHHKCTWQSYTGKKFYQDFGFKPEDFYLLLGLTSWAVCGDKEKTNKRKHQEMEDEETTDVPINSSRELIGRKTKQILDYGRVLYLKELGYDVRLIEYVTKDMTLENIALVATKS